MELPPQEMLQPLIAYSQAHPDKLRLSFFVDSSDGPSHPAVASSSLNVGRIGKTAIERATSTGTKGWWQSLFYRTSAEDSAKGKKVMFLLCGPVPYVKHAIRRRELVSS